MSDEREVEYAHRLVREYATIQQLRDEGLTVTEVSDDKARSLIRLMSSMLDRLTGQFFVPEEMTLLRDGDRSGMVTHPELVPILEVMELYHVSREMLDADIDLLEHEDWILARRWVELVDGLKWPRGVKNIKMHGVFGCLDPQRNRLDFVTTSEIKEDSVDVGLNTVVKLRARDVVLFVDSANNAVRVIVKSVDVANSKILIDKPGPMEPVAIGAAGRTWGPVPYAIEQACKMLVMQNRSPLINGGGPASSLLRRERTDNYEYELFDNAAAAMSDVTGNKVIDAAIDEYGSPAVANWV